MAIQLPPLSASVACVQGLVNIANQINQERQIAAGAPFVTISLFEAAHVTHRSSP